MLPLTSVDVPLAFTPNGDGINDVVYVDGWGIRELLSFQIFNRWGEMVFETDKLEEGWDGYYKGKLQNTETFAYIVRVLTYVDGQVIEKKGYVDILR